MTFFLVLAISLIVAVLFRNRIEWAVVAVIAARYFIPSSASVEFVPFLDPSVYLLVVIYAVQSFWNFSRLIRILRIGRIEVIGLLALVLLAAVSILGQGFSLQNVVSEFIRIYLGPVLLYFLVRSICVDDYHNGDNKALVIVYSYLGFSVAQSVMAIIQEQQQALLVWEDAFRRIWGGESGGFGRSQGFVETGLSLGSSLVPAIALCAWVRVALLKFGLALLFLYAMVLSSSRAALAVGIMLVIVIAFVSVERFRVTNILALGGATAAVAAFVSSGGAAGLLQKIENDKNSTAKRIEAYSWFLDNMGAFVFTGYQGNRDFRGNRVLSSSLENAFFTASANYGVLFALVVLGLLLFIAIRGLTYGKIAVIASIGLIGMIVVENTNTGFSSLSFSGYALWALAGLCSYRPTPRNAETPDDTAHTTAPEPPGSAPEHRMDAPYRSYLIGS